jgi:hypothetical protein
MGAVHSFTDEEARVGRDFAEKKWHFLVNLDDLQRRANVALEKTKGPSYAKLPAVLNEVLASVRDFKEKRAIRDGICKMMSNRSRLRRLSHH